MPVTKSKSGVKKTATPARPAPKTKKPVIKNQVKSRPKIAGGGVGGAREGAGRPKGSRNKRSLAQISAAIAAGETPLEFMLRVMRGEATPKDADDRVKAVYAGLQFEAAKAAAPYIHARLSSTELVTPPAGSENGDTAQQIPADPVDAARAYKDLMG